jgi:hypothetical protein
MQLQLPSTYDEPDPRDVLEGSDGLRPQGKEHPMRDWADKLEEAATRTICGDDYLEAALQHGERLERERKALRHARIINCVVVAAIAFGCWSAFIGLPYLVHDLIQAVQDAWRAF